MIMGEMPVQRISLDGAGPFQERNEAHAVLGIPESSNGRRSGGPPRLRGVPSLPRQTCHLHDGGEEVGGGMTEPAIPRLGLVRTSLVDFPERVSAVVFTSGCNFRCPFCHNPELAGDFDAPPPDDFLDAEEVLAFLDRRRRVLGGVVLTGGEPLAHAAIVSFAAEIRSLGLALKIDTNGSFPERLTEVAPDYVAIDVKTSPDRYGELVASPGAAEHAVKRLRRTIDWVLETGVEHEFRTTVVPGLVDVSTFEAILDLVEGTSRYVLAQFRGGKTLDPGLSKSLPYPTAMLEHLRDLAEARGIPCLIRGAGGAG